MRLPTPRFVPERPALVGILGLLAALLLAAAPGAVAAPALVTDGDFATGDDPGTPFTTYPAGSSIGAWRVIAGSVDHIGTLWSPPTTGERSIDLGGETPGAIETTLPTQLGVTYAVGIRVAGNFMDGTSTPRRLRVSAGETTETFEIVQPEGWSATAMGYALRQVVFVADGPETTLRLESAVPPGAFGPVVGGVTLEVLEAGVRVDYFDGTDSTSAATLLAATAPTAAATSTVVRATLSTPWNRRDTYGIRLRAFLRPATTGTYRFRVAGDDEAALRISTSDDPSGAAVVAWTPAATADNAWSANAAQTSDPIALVAGERYFVEGWARDATGSDGFHAQWQRPDGTWEDVPTARLLTTDQGCSGWCPPRASLLTQPALESMLPGAILTADPGTWGGASPVVQWDRCDIAGTACTPIADATTTSYRLTPADELGTVRVRIGSAGGGFRPFLATGTVHSLDPTPSGVLLDYYDWASGISANLNAAVPSTTPGKTLWRATTASDANRRDNYGTRLRALVTAPVTGTYRLRLTTDGEGAIRLSPSSDPAAGIVVARGNGGTFTSNAVSLTAGEAYFLDAWQRDSTGGDYLTVTWSVSNGAYVAIPTAQLEPTTAGCTGWCPPLAPAMTAPTGTLSPGATLTAADNGHAGGSPAYQWQRCSSTGVACASIAGATDATYVVGVADVGSTLRVTFSGGGGWAYPISSSLSPVIAASGPATQVRIDYFDWSSGSSSSLDAAVPSTTPTSTVYKAGLTSDANRRDNYGTRMRAILTPATTTAYRFQLAADDTGILRMAPSADPAGAVTIAASGRSLTSTSVTLTAGKQYFLEAWGRDSTGADLVRVLWSVNGATFTDVPSSLLAATDAGCAGWCPPAPSWPTNAARSTRPGATLVSGADATATLRWERCDINAGSCAAIAGATGPSYAVTTADLFSRLRVATTGAGGTLYSDLTYYVEPTDPATPGAGVRIDRFDWSASQSALLASPVATTTATSTVYRSTFLQEVTRRDNFGTRMRAIVTAPASGQYRFKLSTDGEGAVRLSPTADPAGAVVLLRASTTLSSTSGPVDLVAGQTYFLEAWGRESTGADYLSVQWSYNAGAYAPIPESALAQTTAGCSGWCPPVADAVASGVAVVGGTLTASVGGYAGSAPVAYAWQRCNVAGASCTTIAGATEATYTPGAQDAGSTIRVKVTPTAWSAAALAQTSEATATVASANVTGARLDYFDGTDVGDRLASGTGGAFPTAGGRVQGLRSDWNRGDGYGVRMRAIITPTATGSHVFRIATGGEGVVRISASTTPSDSPTVVAWARSTTGDTTFGALPTQEGAPLALVAGQSYYLEAWLAAGTGADGIAVQWKLPGTPTWADVPAAVLVPSYAGCAGWCPPIEPVVVSGETGTRHTLTATAPWAGTATVTWTWQRCDETGAGCAAIPGATAATYAPVAADVGSRLVAVGRHAGTGAAFDEPSAPTEAITERPAAPEGVAGLVDWALGADASMTGTWGDEPLPASAALAVDGERAAATRADAAVTDGRPQPSLTVDLGAARDVDRVILVPQGATPLANVRVLLSASPITAAALETAAADPAVTTLAATGTVSTPATLSAPSGTRARYVRVQLVGTGPLGLAELEVLGRPDAPATATTAAYPVVAWTAVAGAGSYRVARDGVVAGTVVGTSFAEVAPLAAGDHTYTITSLDATGRKGATAPAATLTVDVAAPAAPATVAGPALTTAPPTVTWGASAGAARYLVRRDGIPLAWTAATSLADAAAPDGHHVYTVMAIDAAGNASAATASAGVTVDRTAPISGDAPHLARGRAATQSSTGTGTAGLAVDGDPGNATGTASEAAPWWQVDLGSAQPIERVVLWNRADCCGWRLADAHVLLGTTAGGRDVADLALPGTAGPVAAAAPAPGTSARHVRVALAGPGRLALAEVDVLGVAAAPVAVDAHVPALTWTAASDPVSGVAGYRILRDGVVVDKAAGTSWSEPDAAKLPEGVHRYAVAPYDAAGNVAPASAEVAITIDRTPPAAPDVQVAESPTARPVALAWKAVDGATSYAVERDGEPVAAVAEPAFTDLDGLVDGTHVYVVRALDDAGNASEPTKLEALVDATPPGAPETPAILDGGFAGERATGARVPFRDGELGRWKVVDGEVVLYGASVLPGPDGRGRALGLVGAAPGAIEQGVDGLVPGAVYRLVVALAATGEKPSGVVVSSGDAKELLRPSEKGWQDAELVFTATDRTTTIRIAAADADAGTAVSAVRLALVKPLPFDVGSPTRAPSLKWPLADDPDVGQVATYGLARDGAELGPVEGDAFDDPKAPEGVRTYALTAIDRAGNASAAVAADVLVDRTSPSAPTGLAVPGPAAGARVLSWTAASDDASGVASYRVHRDGHLVATVAGTTATDAAAVADGPHTYTVDAVDGAGNVSPAASATVLVDRTAPAAPAGLAAASPTAAAPALSWQAAADAGSGVAGYRIERDGVAWREVSGTAVTDAPTPADGSHVYAVRAVDAAGNASPAATVTVEVDTTVPGAPAALRATTPTASAPALAWTADAAAVRWLVSRDGVELGATTSPAFTDAPRPADGVVTYTVRAVNRAGTVSSPAALAVRVDATAPGVPDGLAAATPTADAPALSWTAATDAGSGVAGYVVLRDGAEVGTPAGPSFVDAALDADGAHVYRVRAVDAAGNRSDASAPLEVVRDAAAPDTPSGLVAAADPTAGPPALSWDAAADATTGVAAYRVERDGAVVATVETPAFTEPADLVDGPHGYRVRAVDAAGNASAWSAPLAVVIDTAAPDAPAAPVAASPTRVAPALAWDAVPGAAAYRVLRDGAPAATVEGTTWSDPAPPADGAHAYRLIAVDAAGNASSAGPAASVVLDTAAPAAPADPAAASPTRSAPALAWQAPADLGTGGGYRVLRDGVVVAELAGTAWADDPAVADGEHAYAVVAVDAAGNASAPSAPVAVVVDRVAPSAPTLEAGPSPTAAAPELRVGEASDDRSGVAGYLILRDGLLDGPADGLRFTDTGADEGLFRYTAVARDAAGNRSAPSAAVEIEVDRTAPAAPGAPTAPSPTAAAPELAWAPVATAHRYRVLRDGDPVATVAEPALVDAPAPPDGEHVYRVVAIDAAGNASAPGAPLGVVVDTAPPAAPRDLVAPSPTASAPALGWAPVADAVAYRVLRDGLPIAETGLPGLLDAPVPADGVHAYRVLAVDAAGNVSAPSAPLEVEVDTVLPSGPTGLAALSPTAGAPVLAWTAPPEGARSYRVYRDGALVGTTAGTTFADVAALADGAHVYAVTAIRPAGESASSTPLAVVVDRAAPSTPDGLAASSPTRVAPALTWAAADDADGAGVAAYRVLRDGEVVGETAGTRFADPTAGDGAHRYAVVAVDRAGNASTPGAPVDVVVDTVAPAAPGAPAATSPTRVAPALTWAPVDEAAAYRVLRDGEVAGTAASPSFADTGALALADGVHAYAVVAVDAAGNASAAGAALEVEVDRVAPLAPGAVAAATPTREQPTVRFLPSAGAVAYRVLRDGGAIGELAGTTFVDADAGDGAFAYTVVALDAAGNASTPSEVAEVVRDTAPPAAPAALVAPSPTSVAPALAWDAVDGAVAYRVLRGDDVIAEVGAHRHVDELAAVEGVYRYRVVAVDAAGNVSEPSAARAVVLDVTPPAAPAVRAEREVTSAAPALAWDAVEGADAYRVTRDGEALATVTGAGHVDADAGEGDHVYRVRALDAAGNVSPTSEPVAVTVDRTAPRTPAPTAASPTNARPRLLWEPDGDAVRYAIERDGSDAGEVDVPVYVEADGPADGTLAYRVRAVDAAGNVSAWSPVVDVVVDNEVPGVPQGLSAALAVTETSPSLAWEPVDGADGYVVERDGVPVAETDRPAWDDVDVTLPGRFTYTVRARDVAGNRSDASAPVAVRFRPGVPGVPGRPDAASPTGAAPALTWEPVPNAAGYAVSRDGVEVGRTADAAFRDEDALADGDHVYTVTALAGNGAESDASPALTVVVDTVPPAAPAAPRAATPTADAPALAWDAVPEAVSYIVLADGVELAAAAGVELVDADAPEGARSYAVVAVDEAGNASAPSPASVVVIDRTPPAAPLLSGVADASVPLGSGAGAVLLEVVAPADAARTVVRRDGVVIRDGEAGALTDDALADGTTYAYAAVAVDAAGNASPAAELAVETPDRTPPAPVAPLAGAGSPLVLTWNPDPGTTFTVRAAGTEIATVDRPTFTDPDAIDHAAPAAPAGLRLTASTPTSASLEWDAPADAGTSYAYAVRGTDAAGNQGAYGPEQDVLATSGVVRYRVLVDGAQALEVDRAAATIEGLAPTVAHDVQVVAVDADGNASEPSEALETGEDVIPAVPGGLAADASPTRTAPVLGWNAVPDAETYRVRRDGEEIAAVRATRFVDEDVPADGPHVYAVAAAGAAELPSAWSDPVTVVVDTTAPDTVLVARPDDPARSTVTVEFSSPDADAAFRCAADGAEARACTSPWTVDGLAGGPHALRILAVDPAGNEDAEPLVIDLEVDDDPPGAPTLALALDPADAARVHVTAAPAEDATRVVVLEGGRVVADGDGADDLVDAPVAPDADGVVTYLATAYDAAGNASAEVRRTIALRDTTPPGPPRLAQRDGYPVRLEVSTDEEGGSVALERDGADLEVADGVAVDPDLLDAAAPGAPTGLRLVSGGAGEVTVAWDAPADVGSPGAYTATASDAAGNVGEPATLDATATSGVAAYRVLVDGVEATRTDATEAVLSGFIAGVPRTIAVLAEDGAGNVGDPSPQLLLATPESAPGSPRVRITGRPIAVRTGVRVRLTASVRPGTAPIADVRWVFDDGTVVRGRAITRVFSREGSVLAQVVVTDTAGRRSRGIRSLLVDGSAPRVRIARPQRGRVALAIRDRLSGVATVTATVDGRAARVDARRTIAVPVGRHVVRVTATDRAGNVRRAAGAVLVDRVGPTIRVTVPPAGGAARVTATLAVTDGGGLQRVTLDGRRVGSHGKVAIAVGRRHVVIATDLQGNQRRLAFAPSPFAPLEPVTDPALDGARGDQLWFDGRRQTGIRLWLLRETEARLVALGYLPADYAPARETYGETTLDAVRGFQVDVRCSGPGKADWGTIGSCTKVALDRLVLARPRTWTAP